MISRNKYLKTPNFALWLAARFTWTKEESIKKLLKPSSTLSKIYVQ